MKDFFISYNKADRAWAEWIAWQLEEAKYSVIIQAWDFRPGSNFALEMQKAAAEACRTVAVLSPDYLNALNTQPEWSAAFAKDPTGEKGALVPVRVRECDLKGLWPQIIYIDLVGHDDESTAQYELLNGIVIGRAKPTAQPAFPVSSMHTISKAPRFPGVLSPVVKNLPSICHSFPSLPEPLIPRDNILDTIESMFTDDFELVAIEGDDGIGKTTLLAQFARRHPNHAFSVFVKPATRFGYDPALVRYDLCCQLLWALHQGDLYQPEEADDGYLRYRLLELRKRAQREPYYFVLDGLADIPDDGIRAAILDMLPLGQGFHFLISGNLSFLPPRIRQLVKCKSWQMVRFSLDETAKYFSKISLEHDLIKELYQACGRGIPGHLASVRRNISAGRDPNTLVKDKLADLFEEEWKQAGDDESALQTLAIITHTQHQPTIEDMARLLRHDKDQVRATITRLTFLIINDRTNDRTSEVTFVSESFRKFATAKLRDRRESVIDMIIGDLLARKESKVAINNLPIYLEQRGKLNEVLECLSPEYFTKIVEHSQSLIPVRQKADLGISTATRLHRDEELIRFSMQKSVITELESAEIWRSEIEALMALNDYAGAMNLSQSMLLREDRLHLLAVIAKSRREQNQPPEAELLQQIRTLHDQIDGVSLRNRAVDIASDLFYSCPDLAIDLVQKATCTEAGENALDLAYAKLSLSALNSPNRTSEPLDKIEAIRSRIKDPKLRSFTAAISLSVGNQTAREVVAEVRKMEATEDRLYLLRQWSVENRKRSDAVDVVEYAIDLAIKTATYAPNARVLRELALPLPFIEDENRARQLVGIFDSQKDTVEHLGPTEDYVRLQLLLARAEKKYDAEACWNRVLEVYCYNNGIDDIATKASCLAWLLTALNRIDPDGELDKKDQIRCLTTTDLSSIIDNLLDETAQHYHATQSIIEALAISNPQMGLELATKLNTQDRRDAAILHLIEAMMNNAVERVDFAVIEQALGSFFDQDERDEAITLIIEHLSSEKESPNASIQDALPFINKISEIRKASQRCRACCLAYSFLSQSNECSRYDSIQSHLLSILRTSWQSIDVGWAKVNTGFRIVRSLAKYKTDLAREYFKQTESVRSQITFNAGATAWTYQICLRLAIRAFAGLLPKNVDTESDYVRISDLIDNLPSCGERAEVWAELALRCFIAERSDFGGRIVNEHVKPLLYSIPDTDQSYRIQKIVSVAPALYKAHSLTAKELIRSLPQPSKDEALARIAEFIMRKHPLSDPYETHDQKYDLDYEDILDIIELISEIERDFHIYHFNECIAETMSSSRYKNRFTSQQRVDIIKRLEEIISTKLPDPHNIQHDGYKIAAKAQIARIQDEKTKTWENLIAEARNIRNLADKAFVLAIIGEAIPSRDSNRRKKTFEEAIAVARNISSFYDRSERLVDLASIIMDTEPSLAKECLRSTMEATVKRDVSDLRVVQKRIVDIAFNHDPDLAASLASLADDDPARGYAKTALNGRLETLKLKQRIIDELPSTESLSASSQLEFSRAAWMALGSLNAGRLNRRMELTRHMEHTREPMRIAANYPLRDAYPIIAWIIENAIRRFSKTDQARTTLRQLLEATLLTVEISARMATRFSNQIQRVKLRVTQESEHRNLLVSTGEREKALQFLRDWFSYQVKDYLKICDQFFGPSDLELLMLLCSANPKCKVYILTSKKHHDQEGISSPDAEYLQQWRRISDQDPPETEIVIVGIEASGKSPIHDRWWLTKGGGLKIGNSLDFIRNKFYIV